MRDQKYRSSVEASDLWGRLPLTELRCFVSLPCPCQGSAKLRPAAPGKLTPWGLFSRGVAGLGGFGAEADG